MQDLEITDELIKRLASEYAQAIDADPRQGILTACRIAWVGMEGARTGTPGAQRRQLLADATSQALARLRFPDDPEAQRRALQLGSNRPGGASVSLSAIAQRANAYGDVLAAGLTPTLENVSAAFILASIGGSKGYRDEVQRRVRGGEDFIAATQDQVRLLTAANKRRAHAKEASSRGQELMTTLVSAMSILELLDDQELDELEVQVTFLRRQISSEIKRRGLAD